MPISVSIRVERSNFDVIGLKPKQVERINRVVSNKYLANLAKFIPPRIASDNNIGLTGFKRHRIKSRRMKARGRGALTGSFWVGENDVLAQFKKGAWRTTAKGSGKGGFFKKDSFILTLKSGKRMLFSRDHGSIEAVRVPLTGYTGRVAQGVSFARKQVPLDFKQAITIEFLK